MYHDTFGFRENPFSIAPDPRYLYPSKSHQEALAHLRSGAESKGGLILLTGETGTGKTMLCRHVLEQLGPTADVALIVSPGLGGEELPAAVCDEFRIPVDRDASRKDHFDALRSFLLEAHGDGRAALLIVDEAQNLDKEALEILRLLAGLEGDQGPLLNLFLLGQPELDAVLRSPDLDQLRRLVSGSFELHGLKKSETREYIEHRISVAGGSSDELFSSRAVKRIHQLTGGLPRLINALCDRSLLGASAENRSKVDDAIVRKAARELLGYDRVTRALQIPLAGLVTAAAALVLIIGAWVGTTSDLFYLKLDTILPLVSEPQQDIPAPPSPVEQQGPADQAITPESAGADDRRAISGTQSADLVPPADEPEPAAAATAVNPPPARPEEPAEPSEPEESVPNNIFISPLQIPPEPREENNTTIVIKQIEIN